jgi:hypothetical protein
MNPNPKSPRNPWPLAIIAWLAAFLVFTAVLVVYISHQKVDLVRGDYYDEEIRYQEQLDRMNRTVPITNQVAVAFDQARDAITINLPPAQAQQHLEGRIRLYRPSDETLDQDIELAISPAGRQELDAKKLRAGLWKVRVYWTVAGRDYYFVQSVVVGSKSS